MVVLSLYLIYLLRRPLTWIFIAGFLAIALSGPVARSCPSAMKRGLAVATVYVNADPRPVPDHGGADPAGRRAGTTTSPSRSPTTPRDLTEFVQEGQPSCGGWRRTTTSPAKLEEQASALPGRLGDAAGSVLSDIGVGLVNSIFAGVTIIVLSAFLMGSGRRWLDLWAVALPAPTRRGG